MSVEDNQDEQRPDSGRKRSVSIREMELDDLPSVFALGERLFTAGRSPTLYRTWDEYELVEIFASEGEFCLVAESEEDRLIGFALGTLMEKYGTAWTYGWLLWLGVDPDFNGRGVGSRLANRLTDIFIENGARIMLVDTDANNEPALRFFRNQGFNKEHQHIYLSKNLESHPKYVERKARRKKATRRRRKKREE